MGGRTRRLLIPRKKRERTSVIVRLWKWFWSPSPRFAWGGIFVVGGMCGLVFWAGLNVVLDYTNTMEFCISCHEMRVNVFEEYKTTIHYNNRTGVRTTCPDCHVPRPFLAKLVAKTLATKDLYHNLMGTIDTPEKFEERREEMAERVWAALEATDSRECRNCHSFEAMDFHKQTRRAREKMQEAKEQGKTCIECHQGIAHTLPEEES
jgi:nitrate/TMAO reductase-like tetraheme cytochrome c subunit